MDEYLLFAEVTDLLHVLFLFCFFYPTVAPKRHADSLLTLLLKSCHDLHVCHVLQFIAHNRDGVILQLRHTHLAVQGRLGADRCMAPTHV